MAEFIHTPVRKKTADWLNQHYSDDSFGGQGFVVTISNKGCFYFDGQQWYRQRVKRDPKPEFIFQIVFGEFKGAGGILGILKMPGKNNWHKKIVPAIKRLIRRQGYNAQVYWNVDADNGTVYNNRNYPCYIFNGTDFVEDDHGQKDQRKEV